MSFGFSVGDGIAVCNVIHDLVSCLSDSSGSRSDYQELIRELELLDRTLRSLDRLTGDVDSIKCAALSCRLPLEQFLTKIKKYETSLGPRSSDSKPKTIFKKVSWQRKKDDAKKLRNYLEVHMGVINISLAERGVALMNITSKTLGTNHEAILKTLCKSQVLVAGIADDVRSQGIVMSQSNNMLSTLFQLINGELKASVMQIVEATQQVS